MAAMKSKIRRRGTGPLLAALVLFAAACDSSTPDPLSVDVEDGTPGHYGGPCNADGTCGPGLVCEHHVCKEASD